ncbi:Hsp20/alpha crystallin family protein [Sphingomonas sp. 2SG]|uniref:Hsp20/alpha crystallin family protein n=1 Tax=Sphingomonas sp. 2SG TaxID=2502201 RepID=UPI0010F4D843|nr:Hsp20/alpha crystallin family protein [Sphingomonas sp. 2SG]
MAIRDLIPWSRTDDRVPAPFAVEQNRRDPLLSLHREVNRLFDDVVRGFGVPAFAGTEPALLSPRLELGETDAEIRVTAKLPGLDEKDVEIVAEAGVLTLRGEKKSEVEDKDRGYSERSYGRYERRIALPHTVETDKASARFRNGVLTVTLPKSAAATDNVRRIPIHSDAA